MKKYNWLVLGTVAAIGLIFGIGMLIKPARVTVKLITVHPQTVQQTVNCTGRVESSDSRAVYVEVPCVADAVYVREGQRVKQGDPLFSIDIEATKQALSQLATSLPDSLTEVSQNEVTAPASGVVSSLNVQAGAVTDPSQPCATITSGEGVQITVAIRERYLPQVQLGQAVIVTGVAFSKEQYSGTLTSIASSAHQQYIGTVSETVVDAVISLNEGEVDMSLRTGLNAQAAIITRTFEDALLVPYDCLTQNETGEECVYVYRADGTVQRQSVEVAGEYATGVLVVSGLSAGERVAQNPENLSEPCVKVQVG